MMIVSGCGQSDHSSGVWRRGRIVHGLEVKSGDLFSVVPTDGRRLDFHHRRRRDFDLETVTPTSRKKKKEFQGRLSRDFQSNPGPRSKETSLRQLISTELFHNRN